MKYIVSIISIFLLSFVSVSDIYSIEVKNIDGNKIDMNQFRGRKILVIVLPLSSHDTTVTASQIGQLQTKYQKSLVVIGIPAEETGFKKGEETSLKKFYKDEGVNIIITEKMNVKKGSQQATLFQWLTSKDKNHHFEQDVEGVGSKFFVDEGGELYGVMGPGFKLTNPLMDKILMKPFKR